MAQLSHSKTVPNKLCSPITLGETIYRLRKCAKVSQTKLASVLDLHQTAICRIEGNEQGITTEQLLTASNFFGVPVDYFLNGKINFWAVAERFGQSPPFAKKYRTLPHSRVRGMLPLLYFLNAEKGAAFTQRILSQFEFDSIFFSDPDQPLSVHFELDLLHTLIGEKILSQDSFVNLIAHTRLHSVHGNLHQVYESQSNSLRLIQSWILNAHRYERNFEHTIEESSQKSIELSITPQEHMLDLQYKDDTLTDYYCRFKKAYLSEFPLYIGQKRLDITEKQCHFHSNHDRCIYVIKVA